MLSFSFCRVGLLALSLWGITVESHSKTRREATSYSGQNVDFIIAGGGTAGLVVANRLSESGKHTVLVLEAGPVPTVVAAYATPGGNQFLKGSALDWGFLTTPQVNLGGRVLQYLRGRGLGGSSAINGLFYGRGSASVFDRWVDIGNPGWGWNELYPLAVRSTRFNPPVGPLSLFNLDYKTWNESAYGDGPLEIGYQGYVPDSNIGFINACSEAANIPIVNDLNAGNGTGIKQGTGHIDSRLRRSSSYDSYYKQAANRTNLFVLHDAKVTGINIETRNGEQVTTGVNFIHQESGLVDTVNATKEVIVSLGAFQTPQLLMLSGIGPQSELDKFKIKSVVVNENVGNHMNDHSVFSIMARARTESSTTQVGATTQSLRRAQDQFYNNLTGPYTAPSGITNGFQQLSNAELVSIGAQAVIDAGLVNQAHIEYLYESVWYPWIPTPFYAPKSNESYISLTTSSMVALSRGNITLRSDSMSDQPIINPNYYSHPTDRNIAIQSFKYLRKILNHPEMSRYTIGPNSGEVSPGVDNVSNDNDTAIFEYIKANTFPNWHASGTAQMRPRNDSGVVDARLRVYGVAKLRVVDCSIIPILPDVNIVGPVFMIGEKGAQLIREDWNDL